MEGREEGDPAPQGYRPLTKTNGINLGTCDGEIVKMPLGAFVLKSMYSGNWRAQRTGGLEGYRPLVETTRVLSKDF